MARRKRHPMQPLLRNAEGKAYFKPNKIVRYMLEAGREGRRFDLNSLARLPFAQEDWEQLAQLIGYGIDGFAELSYVQKGSLGKAIRMEKALGAKEQDDGQNAKPNFGAGAERC